MTKFDKIFGLFLGAVILLIFLLGIFSSCSTTKDLDKNKETITVTQKVDVDSIVKTKVDSVVRHYQEVMKSLDADIIFFEDTIYMPGKERVVNTVKYVPGKGIKASGNIKAFKLKQLELIRLLDEITNERENEVNLRMRAEDSLKYYHAQKSLEKKSKPTWYIWFSLGFITCLGFHKRKLILSLIKKIL